MKYLPLFHHFKAIYQFPKHNVLVKIVANAPLSLQTHTIFKVQIGGVLVSVLTTSVVERGFEFRSGQTKDYTIGICCYSARHAGLTRKSKHELARNHDNMSGWGDMSIHGLLFQ